MENPALYTTLIVKTDFQYFLILNCGNLWYVISLRKKMPVTSLENLVSVLDCTECNMFKKQAVIIHIHATPIEDFKVHS